MINIFKWFKKIAQKPTSVRESIADALFFIRGFGFVPDVIIDVGAANGTSDLFAVYPDVKYLWVEPVQEYEPELIKLQNRYNGRYIIAAAGSQEQNAQIHIPKAVIGSSFMYPAEVNQRELREVKVIKLDSLIEAYDLKGSVIIKVDVQGYELEVMRGAIKLLPQAEVIILECSFFKFFGDRTPQFIEVVNFMQERGFALYDIVGKHCRLLDHALGQVDAIFVKEQGRFRRSHQWSTMEQWLAEVDALNEQVGVANRAVNKESNS